MIIHTMVKGESERERKATPTRAPLQVEVFNGQFAKSSIDQLMNSQGEELSKCDKIFILGICLANCTPL